MTAPEELSEQYHRIESLATQESREKKIPLWMVFCNALLWPSLYLLSTMYLPQSLTTVMQPVWFLLPAIALMRKYPKPLSPTEASRFSGIMTTGIVLLTVPLSLFFNLALPYWIRMMGGVPEAMEKVFAETLHRGSVSGFMLDILMIAVIPAVCEEFFFRGFFQKAAASLGGKLAGVLIAALFFAGYHLNPVFLPFYLLLGIWFGVLYVLTNNLRASIAAHFINNAIGLALYHYWD